MASINYAAREISVKIVYYGPGLSGKTTNLQIIHKKIPQESKSDMVSLATETDRTLFFDFLPLDLGKIKGFSTKFQLYTVPGQVYYNATRKLVLRGVDGIVFVADSSPSKIQENIESYQNLEDNLAEYGYKREHLSITIQYNKRDLPNAMTIDELNRTFNKHNLPFNGAIANRGEGVFESLKMIGKIIIDALNKKYSRQTSKTTTGGPRIPMPPKSLPPLQSAPLPPQQMPPTQHQVYTPPPPPLSPPPIQHQQQAPAYQEPFNPFVDTYGAATLGRMPAAASYDLPPPPPIRNQQPTPLPPQRIAQSAPPVNTVPMPKKTESTENNGPISPASNGSIKNKLCSAYTDFKGQQYEKAARILSETEKDAGADRFLQGIIIGNQSACDAAVDKLQDAETNCDKEAMRYTGMDVPNLNYSNLLTRAYVHFKNKKYVKAHDLASECIKHTKDKPMGYCIMALIGAEQQEFQSSLEAFVNMEERCIDSNDVEGRVIALVNQSITLKSLRRPHEAKGPIERAFKLASERPSLIKLKNKIEHVMSR
jgi:signal recognition particle receptor subunit beta